MRYLFVVIIVQSGFKLYDLTIAAVGVKIVNFAIRSHNGAIMCFFIELKSSLILFLRASYIHRFFHMNLHLNQDIITTENKSAVYDVNGK